MYQRDQIFDIPGQTITSKPTWQHMYGLCLCLSLQTMCYSTGQTSSDNIEKHSPKKLIDRAKPCRVRKGRYGPQPKTRGKKVTKRTFAFLSLSRCPWVFFFIMTSRPTA